MNSVSALKNTKNAVFALITNGVGGNFSIFTVLASIVVKALILVASTLVNALILPSIYCFFKLIKARHKGSKRVYFDNDKYDNIVELVEASPNIMDENGRPIIDPRKEKGVVAGKASIYRLTGVIGSIISLAFSILSLYSFISSLRFKNQMNARDISFTLLSPLVAAVTIFLQKQLVGDRLPKLIKRIGIGRLPNTARDVHHYHKSEPMMAPKTYKINTNPGEVETYKANITKPYYYSLQCAVSLSFAAFAQLIAVYTLPNTMRIPAFVVCANLCFAFSKLILDAYYAYQCNIYDEKNRVVVMGERIREPGAESSDERSRSLLQIRLSGTLSELRGALNTKLDETIGLIQKSIIGRSQLVVKATLLKLALNSLEKPDSLGLAKDIADTAYIAMNIGGKISPAVGKDQRAVYSTGFNGRNPAIVKAEACPDLTQPLKKEAYIHKFKGGKVKMEDQHLCYHHKGLAAAALMNGEIDICRIYNGIGSNLKRKITKVIVTSLELVTLILAAKNSDIVVGDAIDAIEQEIREVTKKAEGAMLSPDSLRINTEDLLLQLQGIESAFGFEVAKVATAGA